MPRRPLRRRSPPAVRGHPRPARAARRRRPRRLRRQRRDARRPGCTDCRSGSPRSRCAAGRSSSGRSAATASRGLMCYAVREALWWARAGHDDILVAYPSVDVPALTELAADPALTRRRHRHGRQRRARRLHRPRGARRTRACAWPSTSTRRCGSGPAHLGVRRSPTRTADGRRAVVRRRRRSAGLVVAGPDVLRRPDRRAARLLAGRAAGQGGARTPSCSTRRAEVVAAARALADLDFVNGGGTGSLHVTGLDPSLTELAAGSGLYAPTLFDGYDALRARAGRLLRRSRWCAVPAEGIVTAYGGGYVASGPPGWSRVPSPLAEQGLELIAARGRARCRRRCEGAGADRLALGDRVWFRHAKAGELAERFDRARTCVTGRARSSDGPRPTVGKGSALGDA